MNKEKMKHHEVIELIQKYKVEIVSKERFGITEHCADFEELKMEWFTHSEIPFTQCFRITRKSKPLPIWVQTISKLKKYLPKDDIK